MVKVLVYVFTQALKLICFVITIGLFSASFCFEENWNVICSSCGLFMIVLLTLKLSYLLFVPDRTLSGNALRGGLWL